MTMVTATRRVQFCAGHRVFGHESKCAALHGHNYIALFTAVGALDPLGRVVDFSVLKERLGGWIDEHWDHGMILYAEDTMAVAACREVSASKLFLLPSNPTAENMAQYLLYAVGPDVLADTGVSLLSVRIWETENCYAEAMIL